MPYFHLKFRFSALSIPRFPLAEKHLHEKGPPADSPSDASRSLPAVSVASRKRLRQCHRRPAGSGWLHSRCSHSSQLGNVSLHDFQLISDLFGTHGISSTKRSCIKYTRKLVSCEYNTSSSAQGQAEHFQRCIIPLAARKTGSCKRLTTGRSPFIS